MLRRSLVVHYKARFVDRGEWLRLRDADHTDGIFIRDPTLRDFLRSGPAVAATLRRLWGFMLSCGRDEAQLLIDAYVEQGGDGGLTRDTLMYSCHLCADNPFTRTAGSILPGTRPDAMQEARVAGLAAGSALPHTRNQLQEVAEPPIPVLVKVEPRDTNLEKHAALIAWCLTEDKDGIAPVNLKRCTSVPWLRPLNQTERVAEFMSFVEETKLWKSVGDRLRSHNVHVPMMQLEGKLEDVCTMDECSDSLGKLPELIHFQALSDFLFASPSRAANDTVMCAYRGRLMQDLRAERGAPSAANRQLLLDLEHIDEKLRKKENAAMSLFAALEDQVSRDDACLENVNGQQMVRLSVEYKQHYNRRGRRYVQGRGGAQGLSKALLAVCCADTVDWDIQNTVFTLVPHLMSLLKPRPVVPGSSLDAVRHIAADRTIASRDVGLSPSKGKELFARVLHGGSLPEEYKNMPFFQRLRGEARLLRWVSLSACPDLYDTIRQEPARKFPESSIFHFWWTPVEDAILEAWVRSVLPSNPKHLSLHFDGLRLHSDDIEDQRRFVEQSERAILERTGFTVKIVRKDHYFFLDGARSKASRVTQVPAVSTDILRDGNCIPLALARIIPDAWHELGSAVQSRTGAAARVAATSGARRYRDWLPYRGYTFEPTRGLDLSGCKHALVHCESRGRPHCVALSKVEGKSTWLLFHSEEQLEIEESLLLTMNKEAMDRHQLVTFKCSPPSSSSASSAEKAPVEAVAPENVQPNKRARNTLTTSQDSALPQRSREATVQAQAQKRKTRTPAQEEVHDDGAHLMLLDLAAGAGSDASGDTDDEDLGDLILPDPGADVLSALSEEVVTWITSLQGARGGARPMKSVRPHVGKTPSSQSVAQILTEDGSCRCPLCPWRTFDRPSRVVHHLRTYHTKKNRYCASGTKQLRVALAMWDQDHYRDGQARKGLLQRSAMYLRSNVLPAVDPSITSIDRHLRLVLRADGPHLMASAAPGFATGLMRCGNVYVDELFAQHVFRLCLLEKAHMSAVYSRLAFDLTTKGSRLVSLLPKYGSAWWTRVLDDLFNCPSVQDVRRRLLEQFRAQGEFESISIDATVKVCMGVLGQGNYRDPVAVRQAMEQGAEGEATYRVLTVRGLSSSVLLVEPIRSEASAEVVARLVQAADAKSRAQVRHVSSDDPGPTMWKEYTTVFPNMRFLSLDPTHIIMIYEATHWHKRTESSTWCHASIHPPLSNEKRAYSPQKRTRGPLVENP